MYNSDVNAVRTVIMVSDIFIDLHLNDVMHRKRMKKDALCRSLVSCDQISTCTKLLNIDHKFYEFPRSKRDHSLMSLNIVRVGVLQAPLVCVRYSQ